MNYELEKVSNCCGRKPIGNSEDCGLCVQCSEPCEYGYFTSDDEFFTSPSAAEAHQEALDDTRTEAEVMADNKEDAALERAEAKRNHRGEEESC